MFLVEEDVMMQPLTITYVNHAAVIFDFGSLRLLCDPWFEGTCFADGWGLKFTNPHAYEEAAHCTHIWISHFHSDHMHLQTLQKLAQINRDILCLANRSANFNMAEVYRQCGFRNVMPFDERRPLTIGNSVAICRVPATSIDNMLLIDTGRHRILNWNDCVLPYGTAKRLSRKLGPLDVFMANYNHARKLFDNPLPPVDEIRARNAAEFYGTISVLNARVVLPFASDHYFRSPHALNQNESLMTNEDISSSDGRVLPWRIGETLCLEGDSVRLLEGHSKDVTANPFTPCLEERADDSESILREAERFVDRVNARFWSITKVLAPVSVEITDLRRTLIIDMRRGPYYSQNGRPPDIALHSGRARAWLRKPNGTEHLYVGAQLDVCTNEARNLRLLFTAALLCGNKLDARSMLRMMLSRPGLRFLWNRREEIMGILADPAWCYRVGRPLTAAGQPGAAGTCLLGMKR
jgi:hypothetical protein